MTVILPYIVRVRLNSARFVYNMSLTFALQALLERHETNMVEAEEERSKMALCIQKLETDRRDLEIQNAKTIQENRSLLDQLEDLNNTVTESDAHIHSLTRTLEATRQELQRLTILAARTSKLEGQLLAMETDQSNLQTQLATSEEESRSALQRWKRAERTIEHLKEQVDRIEREAREERERHVEVVGRMERRTVVEKELESAAGRLKGAAAAASLGRPNTGSNVVSHFVKDILQDNTNLQMGIVELRELLMNSNEEVENLREQMKIHQPLVNENDEEYSNPSLHAELSKKTVLEALPELHVHHHYHRNAKGDSSGRERGLLHRKPKKKRSIVGPGAFAPPPVYQIPRAQRAGAAPVVPRHSAAAILSQTSVSVPNLAESGSSQRWSVQSSQTGRLSFANSSIPSTPQSGFRNSSLFDSIDTAIDSSRPTTPGSSDSGSPTTFSKSSFPEATFRSFSGPTGLALRSVEPQQSTTTAYSVIKGEFVKKPDTSQRRASNESSHFLEKSEGSTRHDYITPNPDSLINGDPKSMSRPFQPQLRRATSHESVLSLSGMDVHTVQQRPSQTFSGQGFTPRNPYGLALPLGAASNTSMLSPTTATGRPAFQRRGDSRDRHRSLLSGTAAADKSRSEAGRSTLGGRVGGWMWGKWGVTPTASTGNIRAKAALNAIDERASGVNQRGWIKGLRASQSAPHHVEPEVVDTSLLQETLGED